MQRCLFSFDILLNTQKKSKFYVCSSFSIDDTSKGKKIHFNISSKICSECVMKVNDILLYMLQKTIVPVNSHKKNEI